MGIEGWMTFPYLHEFAKYSEKIIKDLAIPWSQLFPHITRSPTGTQLYWQKASLENEVQDSQGQMGKILTGRVYNLLFLS